ncbi:MAG: copper-binding protein [Solirubrobacterales bacterium]|nr:copper-binding protein [Solirubrobacterales bacterium]
MSAKPRYHAASATLVLLVVVFALTVFGLLTLNGAEAANTQPKCGETITADTTLDGDLVDCPNHGIVIGADDITLDLNGHRIDGDGTPAAGCNPRKEFCDIGVFNRGHDGVTMRDGSVREFDAGVFVFKARASRVLDISSKKNTSFGLIFNEVSHSRIRDSSGSDNIPPEGDGLGLFGSHDVRIVDNTFRNNPGPGIHVADSTDNLIKTNRLSDNGPAILVEANRNEMRDNRISRGGGIVVGPGNRNVIARNHVARAQESISATGRENLVARNVVVDARGRGISLGVDFADGPDFGGADNIVRRNVVNRSGGDGFLVNHKGSYVLKRNVSTGAKDDGFDVESRSTRLAKNRATRNAALGIKAVKGVIDGGGNRARGNGDKRQCVHVKCH